MKVEKRWNNVHFHNSQDFGEKMNEIKILNREINAVD